MDASEGVRERLLKIAKLRVVPAEEIAEHVLIERLGPQQVRDVVARRLALVLQLVRLGDELVDRRDDLLFLTRRRLEPLEEPAQSAPAAEETEPRARAETFSIPMAAPAKASAPVPATPAPGSSVTSFEHGDSNR